MEELLAMLSDIHPLSPELLLHLASILQVKEIIKGNYLLQPGKVCRNVYFIHRGLLRCLYKKDDKDVSNWFMKERDVIFSVESFYTQSPTQEAIEALEDTTVYFISYEELQDIYHRFTEFTFIALKLTENYYLQCERRVHQMRMQSAGERYAYLCKEYPELVARVADKYLASYLGISKETYSRIQTGRWR